VPVHVDEVEVDVDDRERDRTRSDPDGGDQHGASQAPDPQLARTIARTIALQRSRNLRVCAD
jgi:hypothetical protein